VAQIEIISRNLPARSDDKKLEGKIFPVHAIKAYRGNTDIAPLILTLGTR
jgi:hypothetical protein